MFSPSTMRDLLFIAVARPAAWMTTEQFKNWLTEQELLRKRRKDPVRLCEAVGIGAVRRRTLLHGRDTASKVEALACAHYAHRMEISFEASAAGLAGYVDAKFEAPGPLAGWLEIGPPTLTAQMLGSRFNVHREVVPAPFNPTLARAIHWVGEHGPFVPYGAR